MDGVHDYTSIDDRNYIHLDLSKTKIGMEMRWDDTWNQAGCDLDLILYRELSSGNTYRVRSGNATQIGRSGDGPYELLIYNTAGRPGKYYATVEKYSHQRLAGTPDPCDDVDWFQVYSWRPHTLEHSGTGYSIMFPGTSRSPGALTVGAASHLTPNKIQIYSSRGPTTDGRTKPGIVGADCGQIEGLTEVSPGTSTRRVGANCWFWGTSQAAPHVAGLAALVIDRYDDPDARKYTAEDVVNWLEDTALQRITATDPNNTWGHGFAKLPDPAPTASISPVPSTMNWGTTKTHTITASDVGTAGVDVRLNRKGEDGNLSITSTCTWKDDVKATRSPLQYTFTVKGCTSGETNIRLYKPNSNILLAVYPLQVKSTARTRPTAVGNTETQTVKPGASVRVDMTSKFSGTVERYAVTSFNEAVATAVMDGSTLVITGVKASTARVNVTVTASNPKGSASKTYNVTVSNTTTPVPTNPTTPTNPSSNPPTVNAGSDKDAGLGETVFVSGTGSPVNDDDMTYSWTQESGTTVNILSTGASGGSYRAGAPGSDSFKFIAPSSPADLVFELTVKDLGTGLTASDTMIVRVG